MNVRMQVFQDRFTTMPMPPRIGGFTKVFKGIDTHTSNPVAIKVYNNLESANNEIDNEYLNVMFSAEVEALKKINHKNIIKYISSGKNSEHQYFIITEWIEKSLNSILSEEDENLGDPWEVLKYFGIPLLEALSYLHVEKNIEHRDLKPQNILLRDHQTPVIMDFNIAKNDTEIVRDLTLKGFGTAIYRAPIQKVEPKFSKDIWAIGMVLLTIIRGKEFDQVFEAVEFMDTLERTVYKFFKKALESEANLRYENASTMLASLKKLLQEHDLDTQGQKYVIVFKPKLNAIRDLIGDPNANENSGTYRLAQQKIQEEISDGELFACFNKIINSEDFNKNKIRIITKNLVLSVSLIDKSTPDGCFLIDSATTRDVETLEYMRANSFRIPTEFAVTTNLSANAKAILEARVDFIDLLNDWHDNIYSSKNLENANVYLEELFRFLDAEEEIATASTTKYKFEEIKQVGTAIEIYTDQNVEQDLIDSDIDIMNENSEFVMNAYVVMQNIDGIVVKRPSYSNRKIPANGFFGMSIKGTKTSLKRQADALHNIKRQDPTERNLLYWINSPHQIPEGNAVEISETHFQLDDSKLDVLKNGLGTSPLTLITGPPGTGKTDLIAEFIYQYLKLNHNARILLASQTHIAIDEAVNRLHKSTNPPKMVRLSNTRYGSYSDSSNPYELSAQMNLWIETLRDKSEIGMNTFALKNGKSIEDLNLARKLRSLSVMLREVLILSEPVEKLLEESSILDSEKAADLAEREEKIRKKEIQIEKTISDLKKSDDFKRLPANIDLTDLGEIDKTLKDDSTIGLLPSKLLAILDLQTEWLNRCQNDDSLLKYFLMSRQVIAGTCLGILGERAMAEVDFDLCVIDEATKATASQALVPMSIARKWVLVGDENQLPPFVDKQMRSTEIQKKYELYETLKNPSIFNHFSKSMINNKYILNTQYRMIKPIGELISNCFYQGNLKSANEEKSTELRNYYLPINWIKTDFSKSSFESTSGKSFVNYLEADLVISEIRRLVGIEIQGKHNFSKYEIMVMSGYAAQVRLLKRKYDELDEIEKILNIEFLTIDQAQGRQCDISIISLVRSNVQGDVGFMSSSNRLNVALSRCRNLLFIVGNSSHFSRIPGPVADVIRYIESNSNDCDMR